MTKLLTIAICLLLLSGCGNKDYKWHNATSDLGPFEDDMAFVWWLGYRLHFSCESKDRYALEFNTDEIQKGAERPGCTLSSGCQAKILARTDRNEVLTLPAQIDWDNEDKLFYIMNDADALKFIKQAASAKSDIILHANRNLSSRSHHATFPIDGARDAIEKTLKACGINQSIG